MPNADDVSDPTPAGGDATPTVAGAPAATTPAEPVDLDAIERDLAAVEVALGRLADGTYWTDEVTGGPIPDDVLTHDPLARRV